MLAHRYQVWGWGARSPKGGDRCEKYPVGVVTWAKRDLDSPYEVYNELVAMHLGRAMGMPIPPGIVVEKEKVPFFASLRIGIEGSDLPDADVDDLIGGEPSIACAIVVFDAWTANVDRHERNLWYDIEDKRVYLFDHGCAILNRVGSGHFVSCENDLAINEDNHCLVLEIRSFEQFHYWYSKLCDIPEYIIRDTALAAAAVGIKEDVAYQCGQRLITRRAILPDLFRSQIARFPKFRASLFDPFGDDHNDLPEYCI